MIITVGNHKGGVGKTTTVHSLGTCFAKEGFRTLMVDTDPQSSLTNACGFTQEFTIGKNLSEVLGGIKPGKMPLRQIIIGVGENLDLAPANLDMALTETGLTCRIAGGDTALKKALETVKGNYDIILIDSAPAVGKLTVNAIVAADYIIIPTKAQIVDVRGLMLFRETLDIIRAGGESPIELGILLTFYANYNLHKQSEAIMREQGFPLFNTTIGVSVRVAEAPAIGQSISEYEPSNKRAKEYDHLAKEILERVGETCVEM